MLPYKLERKLLTLRFIVFILKTLSAEVYALLASSFSRPVLEISSSKESVIFTELFFGTNIADMPSVSISLF